MSDKEQAPFVEVVPTVEACFTEAAAVMVGKAPHARHPDRWADGTQRPGHPGPALKNGLRSATVGVLALIREGRLSEDFATFQPLYEATLAEARRWIGGDDPEANADALALHDARDYAVWSTAKAIAEAIYRATPNLVQNTRKRRALLQEMERADARASFYRRELRTHGRYQKRVETLADVMRGQTP